MHLDVGSLAQVLPNPIRVQDALSHALMHAIMVVRAHASKAALTPAKGLHQVLVPIAPIPVPVHAEAIVVADVEVIVQKFAVDHVVTHVAMIAQVSVKALVVMLAATDVVQVALDTVVVPAVVLVAMIATKHAVEYAEQHAVMVVEAVVLGNVIQIA